MLTQAYPFTKEKLNEIEAEEKARQEAQTLESLLVSDERNFVLKHGGAQVSYWDLLTIFNVLMPWFINHTIGLSLDFTSTLQVRIL